jgi:hypothetical protein
MAAAEERQGNKRLGSSHRINYQLRQTIRTVNDFDIIRRIHCINIGTNREFNIVLCLVINCDELE